MIAGKLGRPIRRPGEIAVAIKQSPFDEQLSAPRTIETKRHELVARTQSQLMMQKPRVLQIEAILQVRTHEVSERSKPVDLVDVQIELHRKLPMQPLALRVLQQKINFAEGTLRSTQRHVCRDQPRARAMRQEVFEQRFSVEAEARKGWFVNLCMKGRGIAIERGEPRERDIALDPDGCRLRERR